MNEDMSWLKDIKEGDEIAVDSSSIWRKNSFEIRKVMKITPTGRIKLDNGRQFHPDGKEIGEYDRPLRKITLEILDLVKRKELLYKLKFDKFVGFLSSERLEILLQWQEEYLKEDDAK